MVKLLFLHWCHLQVQHCLGSAGVQDKSNCLKVMFTKSKFYDLWGFLNHLKESLGGIGLVGPVSKPHRTELHPKHRHRSLGALLTQFWWWSVLCLWRIVFKAWGALRNSASFLLVSLFFLLSFWFLLKDAGKWEELFLKDSHQWERNQQSMNMQKERHQNTVRSKKREMWGTSPLLRVLIQQTLLFNTVIVCLRGVGLGQVTLLYVPALPQSAFSWLTEREERDFPSFVLQTHLNCSLCELFHDVYLHSCYCSSF